MSGGIIWKIRGRVRGEELLSTGWRPILEGSAKARALAAVEEIAEKHRARPSSIEGTCGLAVLFAYLDRARSSRDDASTAAALVEHALNTATAVPMSFALHGGFAGVAWTLAHLREQLGNFDLEDADRALLDLANRSPWIGDYGLIDGLVGYGIYALERLPSASAVACLERVIDRLAEIAVETPQGISWQIPSASIPEPVRKRCPQGYYNLGMAHGVPGVIALLGAACRAGAAVPRSKRLLDGAVPWLLAQRLDGAAAGLFPGAVTPGVSPEPFAGAAWDYGDPGIAMALMIAASGAGNASWRNEALAIARHAAVRPYEACGAEDAGFSRGTAGLAHLYNRMLQMTGDETLGQAARFWLGETVSMVRDRSERNADPGLLCGSAGTALTLLAACTPIEPAWDRIFLVSAL